MIMYSITIIACKSNSHGEEKYINIGMVDGWAEGVAMTHVAKAILDKEGYHVIIQKASTDMILASMHNEDTDVFMDVWLPNTHGKKIAKFKDLVDLRTNYDSAKIGLVVPDYVTISSIEELNAHASKFGNRIVGIEKGAGITAATDKAVIQYQLNVEQLNSSTIAMLTELQNAMKQNQWIVIAGWKPHWIFGKMKLKFLADPKKVYGNAEQIHTFARKNLKKDNPFVAAFFSKVHFDDVTMAALLGEMETAEDKEAEAVKWVNAHPKLVNSWLGK